MFRKMGYVLILEPDGSVTERDFVQCKHCQRGIELKPGTWGQVYLVPKGDTYEEQPGCYCRKCMGPLCPACDDQGDCQPWQVKLEKEEAHARLMQAMGL